MDEKWETGSVNGGGRESCLLLAENPMEPGKAVGFSEAGIRALAVWEARPGEVLTVRGPDGCLFSARMLGEGGRVREALCFEALGRPEAEPEVILCPALPEKERFELVLEKATELGVDAVFPFTSKRSATLEARDAGQKKSHRWPHLLRRASRQCRRPLIPVLFPVQDFDALLSRVEGQGLCLVLDEKERVKTFSEALCFHGGGPIFLVVGPEGGWDREELKALEAAGAQRVTLGRRILRTETASILALGLVRYGNFFI